MLGKVMEFIREQIEEIDSDISIASEKIYGIGKIEYVLSMGGYMASISTLSDCTYDFFAVNMGSESMILVKTMTFPNIDGLLNQMKEDLKEFSLLLQMSQ